MWFNLTDEDVETIINDGPGMKMAELAKRLREWKAEQASPRAERLRAAIVPHDEDREVDESCPVSMDGDGMGGYVQTWSWVRDPEYVEDESDDDE